MLMCVVRLNDDVTTSRLSSEQKTRDGMVGMGVVEALVELLNVGTDNGKRYAAIALGWLAYDKSTRILMVETGAVPPLVSLLSSGTVSDDFLGTIVWDNGKIAGAFALGWLANEPEARGKIVAAG